MCIFSPQLFLEVEQYLKNVYKYSYLPFILPYKLLILPYKYHINTFSLNYLNLYQLESSYNLPIEVEKGKLVLPLKDGFLNSTLFQREFCI